MKKRCGWVTKGKAEKEYHDTEWGIPIHNDRLLFEFLILEGAQAGLSWSTILAKRENYRIAFNNFDAKKIAEYGHNKIAALLLNKGIVRNKLKINSAVSNAKAFLDIQNDYGSFDKFIWSFVNGKPILNKWKTQADRPVKTEISDQMSKALIKKGFKFTGSTICYAFMQAVGMVNDHEVDCFRHKDIAEEDETVLMPFRIGEPVSEAPRSMRMDIKDFIE